MPELPTWNNGGLLILLMMVLFLVAAAIMDAIRRRQLDKGKERKWEGE